MALSDEQIEILTDKYLMDLYQDLEQEVIQDIARRVRKTERLTETAEIMAKSMAEQGYDPSEIYSEVMKSLNANKAYQELIAENTREYKREVMEKIRDTEKEAEAAGNKLIAEAGTMSFNDDLQMWQQAKQDLPGADGMKQIVEGFQKQTAGELRNLTRTTGFKGGQLGTVKVQNAYQRSLDLATLKMCSGAFSYDQACNDSIKQLAQSGLRSINYASGRTYQLDTAVRMCVRTAGSQLAGKITEENCNKTGQDLVITSQHIGARPSHLNFENKVFSLSGKSKKYPAFSDPIEAGGAGYGEVAGIKGVNCRHDFFPFWEGISKIPKTIEQPEPKWYQGREYNYYDATQKQRAMEREIRALKRERYSTDDPDERRAINRQIKEKSKEYRDFSKAMDIRPKENRLLMPGERNPYISRNNYADEKSKHLFSNMKSKDIKYVDDQVKKVFRRLFPGYDPAPLVGENDSYSDVLALPVAHNVFSIERVIKNAAYDPKEHVDIGNNALANSIHERAHDVVKIIAEKRVGIIDESLVTKEQLIRLNDELSKMEYEVYEECFEGMNTNEILNMVETQICSHAIILGETVPEALVKHIGSTSSDAALRVYNYVQREWQKWVK